MLKPFFRTRPEANSYSLMKIGASFMSKMITVNGKNIKYQIWDTAGQEKYHSLAREYLSFPNMFNYQDLAYD